MAQSAAVVSSNSNPLPPTTFNISNLFPHPMESNTFLCWQSQFMNVLEIHDLQHVVDLNFVPPMASESPLDPAYSLWKKQDKPMLSWIKETIKPSLQILLLPCNNVAEAWNLLNKRLSPLSKVHIRSLREQLRSLKKASDLSISDYLLRAKNLFDSHTSTSNNISEQDLIDVFTDDLGSDYKEFITSLHLHPSKTFDELYDLLLEEEALANKMNSRTPLALIANKNAPNSKPDHTISHPCDGYHRFNQGRTRGRGRGFQRHHHHPNIFHKISKDSSGLLPTTTSITNSVQCQICNQPEQSSHLCPKRGNFAYTA